MFLYTDRIGFIESFPARGVGVGCQGGFCLGVVIVVWVIGQQDEARGFRCDVLQPSGVFLEKPVVLFRRRVLAKVELHLEDRTSVGKHVVDLGDGTVFAFSFLVRLWQLFALQELFVNRKSFDALTAFD